MMEYPFLLARKAALACLVDPADRAGSPVWDKTLCSP